eukprot:SAG31_NODE_32349_length_357_cov_0.732558_1_plen_102_part_01
MVSTVTVAVFSAGLADVSKWLEHQSGDRFDFCRRSGSGLELVYRRSDTEVSSIHVINDFVCMGHWFACLTRFLQVALAFVDNAALRRAVAALGGEGSGVEQW